MGERNIVIFARYEKVDLFIHYIPANDARFQGNLKAQVSHGGRPLPLSLMRSTNGQMFKEMPPFDVQEELRIDSLNESDLRSGFVLPINS